MSSTPAKFPRAKAKGLRDLRLPLAHTSSSLAQISTGEPDSCGGILMERWKAQRWKGKSAFDGKLSGEIERRRWKKKGSGSGSMVLERVASNIGPRHDTVCLAQ
ncbi:hypothetical protein MRB53_040361 [Persea americana]|nr:hypothetical protein MRB53_040361 [Persea americana]